MGPDGRLHDWPLSALTGRYAGDRRMRRIAPFRSLPGTGADGSRGDLPEIGTADRIPLQRWNEEEAFVGAGIGGLDLPLGIVPE